MGKGKLIDLTGQVFARLIVLERAGIDKGGKACWKVVCQCGQSKIVRVNNLKAGIIRSCGCLRKETSASTALKHVKHGHSRKGCPSPTYGSFKAMKKRCLDPNKKNYPAYGGAGITISPRWLESFENFLVDMGPRPPGTTLGRYWDVGNYEKSNCSWQTPAEQVASRRPDRKYRPKKKITAIYSSDALPISQLNENQVSI